MQRNINASSCVRSKSKWPCTHKCTHSPGFSCWCFFSSVVVVVVVVFAFWTARFSCVATTVIYLLLSISLTLICSPISLCIYRRKKKRQTASTPPADMCDSLRMMKMKNFSRSRVAFLSRSRTHTCVCAFSIFRGWIRTRRVKNTHTDFIVKDDQRFSTTHAYALRLYSHKNF